MPRPAKPPRLLLRKRKNRQPVYVILDAGKETSTGFGPERREEAETSLANYIAAKWEAPDRASDKEMAIADALTAYALEHAPTTANPARIGYAIEALMSYWADKSVSEIGKRTCAAYAQARGVGDGTIRRELGVLRAALNYCVSEEYLRHAPAVKMPDRPAPKERWLTRQEVAKLIRQARKSRRTRHVAKFILVAVYTGTRSTAILNLGWRASKECGHIDLEQGILYRSGQAERQTKKRRRPARLPRQLLLHARLWRKNSPNYVVCFNGNKVMRIKNAFASICEGADLEDVTPHTLKHTAITWAMQNGANPTDAANFFSTTLDTLERVYMHHHPDFQSSAVSAMEGKRGKAKSTKT